MTVYSDLLRYRELFANLFRRDFQAKYKGSLLGIFWSLLNPLVLLGVYLVVFGLLFQNKHIAHYPVYLLAGLACWIFFSVSLQTGARSMVDSAELIKKVRFPRQLVAFSMVATQAVTFGLMLVLLIVLSLVFVPDARSTVWLAIPLALLFAGLVAGPARLALVVEGCQPLAGIVGARDQGDLRLGEGQGFMEAHRLHRGNGVFPAFQGCGRHCRNPADHAFDAVIELLVRDDLVGDADLLGPGRRDQLPGQAQLVDVARMDHPAQVNEHLHREHADLALGQAEAGRVRGDHEVAQGHQAHAASDAVAIDAADERDAHLVDDAR